MLPNLQDTKSHQGFTKIILVGFGVSVNWWQISHFKLQHEKHKEKIFLN